METAKEVPKFNDRSDLGGDPKKRKTEKKRKIPGKRALAVDWGVLEREYLYGIVIEVEPGKPKRVYPSLREIAERHSLVVSTVASRSKRHNWLERRREFQRQLQGEFDSEVAKARATSSADVVAMVDAFIRHFDTLIRKKAIKTDTINDLERAVRLKKFVESEVEGASGRRNGIDLDELQARHRQIRERAKSFGEAEFGRVEGREERENRALDDALGQKTNTSDEDAHDESAEKQGENATDDELLEADDANLEAAKAKAAKLARCAPKVLSAARLAVEAARARRELAAGVADPWRRVELRLVVLEAEAHESSPPRRARSRAA